MGKIINFKNYLNLRNPIRVKFLIPFIKPNLEDDSIKVYTVNATVNGRVKTLRVKTDYSLLSRIVPYYLSIDRKLDLLYSNTYTLQDFGRFNGDLCINTEYWIDEIKCLYPVINRPLFKKKETLYYPVKVYDNDPKKESFLNFEDYEPESRLFIKIPERGIVSVNNKIDTFTSNQLFIPKGTSNLLIINPIDNTVMLDEAGLQEAKVIKIK